MKILVLSDLHLDLLSFTAPQIDVDVIVLAGDIHKGNLGIYWARETWPDKPIVYVGGNHEFYNYDRMTVLEGMRSAAIEQEVYFLDNDEVFINGVRFIGCTLWSDFRLFGKEKQQECIAVAKERMCDFSMISERGLKFTPEDCIELHLESKNWLTNKLLKESFDGTTVVVTHHCPSWESVAPKYRSDLLSSCFASRLDDLVVNSSLWIHGHTHESFDYELNGTRVVCNPRGYISRGNIENPNFESEKTIFLPCITYDKFET